VCTLRFDDREQAFLEQKDLFVAKALEGLGYSHLSEVRDLTTILPSPLPPTLIKDYRGISPTEREAMRAAYWGGHGVAHFIVTNPNDPSSYTHPLLEIASQLSDVIPLKHPVIHPMETHPEAISRFGPQDGTLKIYDLDTKDGSQGYREQAETNEMFDAHNDGLGYAGAVRLSRCTRIPRLFGEDTPIFRT
jgi:hypothetical protein